MRNALEPHRSLTRFRAMVRHSGREDLSATARSAMLDIVFIVAGIGFFLLTSAYAQGCERA